MHTRSTFSAFALAIGLALYYLLVEMQFGRHETSFDGEMLIGMEVQKVTAIEVAGAAGSPPRMRLTRSEVGDRVWSLEIDGKPVRTTHRAVYKRLLQRPLQLPLVGGGELNTAQLADYGLDKPRLIARISGPQREITLEFGGPAIGARVYVRRSLDPERVYLASEELLRALDEVDQLRDRRLLVMERAHERLQRLEVLAPDGTPRWSLRREGDAWRLGDGDLAREAVSGQLSALVNARFAREQPAPADAPISCRLRLAFDEGEPIELAVGERLGPNRWLQRKGQANRRAIDVLALRPFLALTADALREPQLFLGRRGPRQIKHIEVASQAKQAALASRDPRAIKFGQIAGPPITALDPGRTQTVVRLLDDAQVEPLPGKLDDARAKALGLDAPVAVWRMTRHWRPADGKIRERTTEVRVGAFLPGGDVAVQVVGRPTAFKVSGRPGRMLATGRRAFRARLLTIEASKVTRLAWTDLRGKPRVLERVAGQPGWTLDGKAVTGDSSRAVDIAITALAELRVDSFHPMSAPVARTFTLTTQAGKHTIAVHGDGKRWLQVSSGGLSGTVDPRDLRRLHYAKGLLD